MTVMCRELCLQMALRSCWRHSLTSAFKQRLQKCCVSPIAWKLATLIYSPGVPLTMYCHCVTPQARLRQPRKECRNRPQEQPT
jgi:hypothetical protein